MGNCWRGRGTLQTCNPPSLVFNQATGQCDWPSNVACIQGDIEEEGEVEKEPKSPQIDLTLPNCADYAALGYKCVDFWECSTEGNIVDNPFEYHGGEGLIDARSVGTLVSWSGGEVRVQLLLLERRGGSREKK